MRREEKTGQRTVKNSLFPLSLFGIFLGVLFLMSGIHVGLVVLMNSLGWNELLQTLVPMTYWGLVAMGLTFFTRKKMRDTYEEPLHRLAEGTRKVAEGGFLRLCAHSSYFQQAGLSGCDDSGFQ